VININFEMNDVLLRIIYFSESGKRSKGVYKLEDLSI